MILATSGSLVAAGGRWHLGIGDPDALAWCIVGGYVVTAGFAARAFLTARRGQQSLVGVDRREWRNQRVLARLWLAIATVLLALGLNKQLDLQTWMLQTLRRKAYEGGWYDDRRTYQTDFIGAVLVLGSAVTCLLAYSLRHVLGRVLLTVAGMSTLVLFVVVRAASFHYVDRVLALGGRVRINVILELGGIVLVVVSTLIWQGTERALLEAAHARAQRRREAREAAPLLPEPAPFMP
ncbi:MAG: hypothetical protein JWM12_368 [Ilumatobacteraceae bacterium]|nr:hypothetical protein [Ilumatobacteraceae bacterium]